MKEYPILMNTEAVKATRKKRKTQTRRPIKKAWDGFTWAGNVHSAKESGWIAWWPGNVDPEFTKKAYDNGFPCPYGQPGDKLWVRETCFYCNGSESYVYKADNPDLKSQVGTMYPDKLKWCPSIYMPRKASRITLEVVDVRVERLQEITGEDCIKEGMDGKLRQDYGLRYAFGSGWNSIYAKKPEYQWEVNLWVWVIEFGYSLL